MVRHWEGRQRIRTGVSLNRVIRHVSFGFGIVFGVLEVVGDAMMQKIKSMWDPLTKREIREIAAPITVEGIEGNIRGKGNGGHKLATEFDEGERPDVFTPSTAIISGGYGLWELEVPGKVRKHLVDMTLKIETVRTHGMLHSPKKGKSASIFVNNQLVDKIYLVRPHPHGEDYGVDSRRPFPIFRYISRDKNIQTVKINVDEDVKWDIDRVTLEPIILTKEWKPEAAMIIGAIISALIGGIISFFV